MLDKYVSGTAAYNYGSALPYESQQIRPQLKEVKAPWVNKNRIIAKTLCVYMAVVFVLLIGILYSQVLVMQAKSSIDTMEQQLAAITEENSIKKIQLEQSVDLKKIEEIAISQYGMQRPDNNQIIYVRVVQDDYGEVIKN